VNIPLPRLEAIIGASGIAPRIEALLPAGVRHRQLRVATLILGMMLTLADRRPAHLTEVHAALTALPPADQWRLGVTEDWTGGPHQLTYRQAERTFGLITKALAKDTPDGIPSATFTTVLDDLLEASIPGEHKTTSASLAADWTDVETFSRPPHHGSSDCADPEASWGHRNSNLPGPKGELFFGYYLSAATMVRDEDGPPVPELTRRITLSSCHADPVRALTPVLTRMPGHGIALGDILADSGYAHRDADAWAFPLRAAGAQLIQDLHPADRGPQGTYHGAIIANGNLYCPATPQTLLRLGPLAPAATPRRHRRARPADRGTRPPQTRPAHRRRRRRLPPRHLPRGHGQTPLPAAARLHDPRPVPPGDPDPAAAPAGLLHPADPHHRAGHRGQDPAETRLPLAGAPPLLCPPHRR
jgi:hypothetical protein